MNRSQQIIRAVGEMAMPRAGDLVRTYYHGTPTEKAGQAILRQGIQPGSDFNTIAGKHKKGGLMTPVRGKTYITPDLRYAVIYALGGQVMGFKASTGMLKASRFGYLFVIDGHELKDIQPDEDSVGEMVYKGKPEWLVAMAGRYLTDREFGKVKEGEYSYWAKVGKKLMPRLSDAMKLELIDLGAHIAHAGPIHPREAWKIDKTLSEQIRDDATNFFTLAERVR